MNTPIRILLADDHAMLRTALANTLAMEPDLEIVGEACDGEEAVELAVELLPDVVVMDISMPRLNGIQATQQMVASCPAVKVIGLSMHNGEVMAPVLREAGAVDYVRKDAPLEELLEAIRATRE